MNKKQAKIVKNQQVNQNLLNLHRNQIDFLNIFTLQELQYMNDNYDTIVFSKGSLLTKQKQIIDYIAVIINGGAFGQHSKIKYQKGSLISNVVSMGILQNQKNSQSIIAQSDGILFSIRLQILIANLPSQPMIQTQIKSKIINYFTQQTLCQLKKQHKIYKNSLQQEFQQINDEKIIHKFVQTNKSFGAICDGIGQLGDTREKQKLMDEFPIYGVKQKCLIRSKNHTSPFLLIVLKGQIIVKYHSSQSSIKKSSKIIDQNYGIYNSQGFIFGHNQFANLYAVSNQVIFWVIDKNSLINNFKILTLSMILKVCLQGQIKRNQYQMLNVKKQQITTNSLKNQQIWSPFRKSFKIQQIPIKRLNKQIISTNLSKKKDSINTPQTLYLMFLGSNKNKTKQSTTLSQAIKFNNSNELKVNLKSQSSYNNMDNKNKNEGIEKVKKLQAEIYLIKQQNRQFNQQIKKLKLQLLESDSRLKMNSVFLQIRNSSNSINGKIGVKVQKQNQMMQSRTVTLKQAFEKHLKSQRLSIFVSKCAYKWLQSTRRNRYKQQNKSYILQTQSMLLNSNISV